MEGRLSDWPILLGVLSTLASRPSAAQARFGFGTPEEAAETVLGADSLHDWRLLLAMAHPAALEEHKRGELEFLTLQGMDLPRVDPCMTRQIEAWRQMLLDSVYRVPSLDSLRNLAPDSLFARDQRFFGSWARLRTEEDSFEPTRAILGHVLADDSTAYVVLEFRYP